MEERKFRSKITWFTFVFSLFVVWVHAYNGELFLGKTTRGEGVNQFEHMIGDSLGQIAVPGFFLISAYLFYRNFHWGELKRKWISRFHSVLIPYVLWTALYYLGYVAGSRLPFVERVMGKGRIPLDLEHLLDGIVNFRYLYVFWYLRQLIFLILLAPFLYVFLRRKMVGTVFLALVFGAVWTAADFPYINEDALFYYGCGGFLALHGHELEKPWSMTRFFGGVLFLGAGALNYWLTARYFLPGTTVLYRICTPIGLWLMVNENYLPKVKPWMECNFFLYAVHFALVRLLNKSIAFLAPPSVWLPVALYLAMPFLMASVSYGGAAVMKRYVPGIWRVLNGGR